MQRCGWFFLAKLATWATRPICGRNRSIGTLSAEPCSSGFYSEDPAPRGMWGLFLQVDGARVTAHVPGWLLAAAASYAAIRQVRRIALALTANPAAYGFDPSASYRVLFQTWDRALSGARSLAFGRNISGHAAVELIPDVYFIDQYGFRALHDAAASAPVWSARSNTVAWRGSVTGGGPYADAGQIPRLALARLCRAIAGTDIKIIGIHETMAGILPHDQIAAFIDAHQLAGAPWRQTDFAQHKLVIDIDGHANAWGLLEKLIFGCCVIKVASPYEQWFYARLEPWTHYVPVRADLSDLEETIAWCRENDDRCAWIGRNAACLAQSLTLEADLSRSCDAFMKAARQVPRVKHAGSAALPTPQVNASDTLGSARLWRDLGRYEEAIADYAHLIDNDSSETSALFDRAWTFSEMGEFAAASVDIEAAKASLNDDAQLLLSVGRHMISLNHDAEAVAWLSRAVAAAPTAEEQRIDLAAASSRLDWLDIAHAAALGLPDDLPGSRGELRTRSITAFTARRDAARVLLRRRRTDASFSRGDYWELAICLYALGRLTIAQRICEQLTRQQADEFPPFDLISKIIWRRSGPAAALTYLQGLPPRYRDLADHRVRVVERLHDLGRYQEVVDSVQAEPALSSRGDVRLLVAIALVQLGRPGALNQHCLSWMQSMPGAVHPARILCSTQRLHREPGPLARPENETIPLLCYRADTDDGESLEPMSSWAARNAAIRQDEFDSTSARDYLAAHYGPEFADTFTRCDPSLHEAYFRLAWLHRTGGVWIKPRQICVAPMGRLLATAARSELAAVRVGGSLMGFLDDAILAGRAGSIVMERAFIEATAVIQAALVRAERLDADRLGADLITQITGRALAAEDVVSEQLVLIPLPQFRRFAQSV